MPPPAKRMKTTYLSTDQDQNQGARKVASIPLPRRSTLLAMAGERNRERLSTLPFDVIGEISNHLHPRDLLNLALTCKHTARFLLNSHQEYIWRNARLRIPGLPELPPFMTERAFARFLYSRRCNLCGKDNVQNVRWTWFARYCSECLPIARYDGKSAYDKYYTSSDYLRDNEDLQQLVNVINPSKCHDTFTRKGNYVQRRQLDQFLQEWHAAGTEDARRALLKTQKRLVKRREKHAKLCQRWSYTTGAVERKKAKRLARIDTKTRC